MTGVKKTHPANQRGGTPMTKLFDLGDILSCTTGRLVSRRHMAGIYELMSFLLGTSIYTHQIPQYSEVCQKELLRQHPMLSGVELEWEEPYPQGKKEKTIRCELGTHNWEKWLDRQEKQFGKTLLIDPMENPPDASDPIGDLLKKVGSDKVIVVEVPEP